MKRVIRGIEFDFKRTYIMGILNVTPDSFSDGGLYAETGKAVNKALKMAAAGADIIDIGGESTRPGSARVTAEEEMSRVIDVIKGIREKDNKTPISIDTYKSVVAAAAVSAGADIINDVSAGTIDKDMFAAAAETKAHYIMMHMQGTPGDMQDNPVYSEEGVTADIVEFFRNKIEEASSEGVDREKIMLDPGIGFGKTTEHNLDIMNNLKLLKEFNLPIVIGTSRKTVIGNITGQPADKRVYGTAATVTYSMTKGADIVRVHDVREIKDVVLMTDAMISGKRG